MSLFDPVAASLREAILAQWESEDRDPDATAQQVTLDTNSVLVEARSGSLFAPLVGPLGPGVFDGLDVVDLGCGFGAMSLLMACLGARVTGIDPHAERLSVARSVATRHGLDARFSQGRMEALALADQRHDLAVINNALCYLVAPETRASALSETHRVLLPSGRVLIREPNRRNPRDQFTGLPLVHQLSPAGAAAVSRRIGRPRSDVRLHGPAGLRRELRRAGFVHDAQLPVRAGRRAELAKGFTGYIHVTALRPDRST